MTTQEALLREARAILDGRSRVEPSTAHLIAFELEVTRLNERIERLIRTIGMLDQLHPDELEKRLS